MLLEEVVLRYSIPVFLVVLDAQVQGKISVTLAEIKMRTCGPQQNFGLQRFRWCSQVWVL